MSFLKIVFINMFRKPKIITRKDLLIAVSLALFSLALNYLYIVPEVCGVYHDDAIYVITAKAIAQGDGYRLINLPSAPKQTKYPILYPLLLATIWKFWPQFPQNIFYMQFMTSFLSSLAIGICYLFLSRFNYCSRFIALISCAVCIIIPEFLYFSTNTLTEIPFLLLVIISLWAIDYCAEQLPINKLQEFSLGILLALPFLCRSIGVVLIISGLIFWFFRIGSVKLLMVGVIVAILPWLIWVYGAIGDLKNDPAKGYYTDYLGWWMEFGPSFMTEVVFFNFLHALNGSIMISNVGLIALLGGYSTRLFSIPALIVGAIPWAAIILYKGKSMSLKLFLIGYFLIVCIWPWPPYRFLIPILPFLIAYFFVGVSEILGTFISSKATKLFIILIACILFTTNMKLVFDNMKIRNDMHFPLSVFSEPVKWDSYKNLFEWLKMNTLPEETIASGLDTMTYLYTGRTGIRPFFSRPTSLFYGDDYPATGTIKELCIILYSYRSKYLVQTPMPGFSEKKPLNLLLNNLLVKCPNCLSSAYIGEDSRFIIYEINNQEIEKLIH